MRHRLGILLFSLLASAVAMACSCVPPPPSLTNDRAFAEWRIAGAQVVFEGVVEKIQVNGWPMKPVAGETVTFPKLSVTFSSVHLYKGQTSEQFVVETGLGGGDCGFNFVPGKSYLVFAWQEGQQLSTSICSGTEFLADAGAELRLLRGEAPTPEDVVDWRTREQKNASEDLSLAHQICGKVSLPRGTKATSADLFFWPADKNDLAIFRSDSAHSASDGSYCVGYLDPGRYLIGALQEAEDQTSLRYMSYYPGVAESSKAIGIEVGERGKTVRADFSLLPQHLYKLQGYLRGAPDNSPQSILVMLMSTVLDPFHMSDPVELGPHGFFEFEEVPPGHYTVFAATEEGESVTFLSAGVEVDVNKNIDGLKLDYVSKE